jgi:hypothetical protein
MKCVNILKVQADSGPWVFGSSLPFQVLLLLGPHFGGEENRRLAQPTICHSHPEVN